MKREDFKVFKCIPTLTTERLTLRKIQKFDLEDVFEYTSDTAVSEFLLWYPHKNREETDCYLNYLQKLYKKGKFYDWGIEIGGKMIGTAGFSKINIKDNSAEIGYVLNRSFWGKGIAVEAIEEIVKFGFSVLKLDKISAVIISENKRSAKVLSKCNFKEEKSEEKKMQIKGALRSISRFSISRELYLYE